MNEFNHGKATIRVCGSPNREQLEAAALKFLKKAMQQKSIHKEKNKNGQEN